MNHSNRTIFGLDPKLKWKMVDLSLLLNKAPPMTDDRITNLEIKLSFTEDLIEKLNETVYKQQQQIEFLYRELPRSPHNGTGRLRQSPFKCL